MEQSKNSRSETTVAEAEDQLPDSVKSDEQFVRALEDSGYPVDGAKDSLLTKPDGTELATGRSGGPTGAVKTPHSQGANRRGKPIAATGK